MKKRWTLLFLHGPGRPAFQIVVPPWFSIVLIPLAFFPLLIGVVTGWTVQSTAYQISASKYFENKKPFVIVSLSESIESSVGLAPFINLTSQGVNQGYSLPHMPSLVSENTNSLRPVHWNLSPTLLKRRTSKAFSDLGKVQYLTHIPQQAPEDAESLKRASKLKLGSVEVARLLHVGFVRREWIQAASESKQLPGTLLWPVQKGQFVRGFGSGEDGYHQAVDIAGRQGWSIHASADGIVAYAGSGMRGYGNIVFLIHSGGWVTSYAHNQKNLVSKGQKVKRGEVIALLGNTGISRGPHLHFEFSYNGKNCDPLPLFRPRKVPFNSALITSMSDMVWNDHNRRPESIQCEFRRWHPRSKIYRVAAVVEETDQGKKK